VEVDGVLRGITTPSGQINIERGNHRVKISKEGYSDYETSLYVKGGENLVLGNVKLEYIQTGLLVGIDNFKNAYLRLNGKYYPTFVKEQALSPGVYNLVISRAGFESYSEEINIRSGKSTDISSISLKEISVPKKEIVLTKAEELMNPTWTVGIGYLVSQSTVKENDFFAKALAISLRAMPWNRLGFDLGVFDGNAPYDNKNKTSAGPNTRNTRMIKYGMPLMIYRPEWNANDSIFLIPEYVHVKNDFSSDTETQNSNSTTTSNSTYFPEMEINQIGRGGSIEYRSFCRPEKGWEAVVGIDIKTGYHEYKSVGKLTGSKALSASIELILGY
jgi:hypothetical protein